MQPQLRLRCFKPSSPAIPFFPLQSDMILRLLCNTASNADLVEDAQTVTGQDLDELFPPNASVRGPSETDLTLSLSRSTLRYVCIRIRMQSDLDLRWPPQARPLLCETLLIQLLQTIYSIRIILSRQGTLLY